MTFGPESAPRAADDTRRWQRWVEDQLKLLRSSRGTLERGSVSGGVITVRELLRDPAGPVGFINTDTVTAAGPGDVTLRLSAFPKAGSEHVYWEPLHQPITEYSLVDNVLTVPGTTKLPHAGDMFSCSYAVDTTRALPAHLTTFRVASAGAADAWTIPATAVAGDLLVAVGMMAESKTPTLNGWTLVGQSAVVAHAAFTNPGGDGLYHYRMVVMTKVYDGTPVVPTVVAGPPQTLCLMSAFQGGSIVEDPVFATLADGAAGNAPASNPSSLRVWGTIGDHIVITPSQGTAAGSFNGVDISAAMTVDSAPGAVQASGSATAGWCMATLVVR